MFVYLQVQDFEVGDRVSIGVPKLDRTSTDLLRLPGKVLSVHGKICKQYKVATEFGVLNGRYRSGDLQVCC